MKAEIVADSVEANPFPYKVTKPGKKQEKIDPNTHATKLQGIHFLPAQQSISQTSRAIPAIIPIQQEFNQLKNKSARERALDSLRCQLEEHQRLKRKQDVRIEQQKTSAPR